MTVEFHISVLFPDFPAVFVFTSNQETLGQGSENLTRRGVGFAVFVGNDMLDAVSTYGQSPEEILRLLFAGKSDGLRAGQHFI